MQVAINCKKFDLNHLQFIQKLIDTLILKNIDFSINDDIENFDISKYKTYNYNSDFTKTDYFLSIGGDGTLLNTATYIGGKNIPILGINTGRLGFLVTTTTSEIESALELLIKSNFEVEERALINMTSSTDYFEKLNFALNEVAILKQDSSSMITINVHLNGQFLNSYWADGLVISTPTGSTGYSLSCGGPLVMPGSENFIISPVCPHNLNVRPLVVNDNSELSIEVESRNENFLLVLDSRSMVVTNPLKIVLKKEQFRTKIIKFTNYSYFDTLREKLYWGSDARN